MNILTLSTTFPNPAEPAFGIFVRARMERVGALAGVRVVAPVAWLDYSRTAAALFRPRPPRLRKDGTLVVHHPRWFYPPLGGAWNAAFLFAQCWPVAKRLDREAPIDVIDAHFGHPDGVAAALLGMALGRPFMVTLRGNETMHASYFFRKRALRWALRRAAGVIAVSGELRDFAVSLGAAPGKVRVIPNGVDTSIFFPRPRSEAAGGAKVILSAGYLIERKGHHHVIRAVARLLEQGVPCELWIAGGPGREGRFEHRLRSLVKELQVEGAVHFLGPVPPARLAELMSQADVFCLASSREGWPNVVNEALACGTPVVATRIGGVPELLPGRDYGITVEPGDQHGLEEALHAALLRDWDREAIARWGQSRSWDNVAREVVEFLQQAIQRR